MTAPSSLSADFGLGIQANQSTVATQYTIFRMRESMMTPVFEEANVGDEHGIANSSRPTLVKSTSRRTGWAAAFGGSGFLYPTIFPFLLIGLGFEDTVTGTGPDYTHTFTIASRDEAKWLSAYHSIGEGANAFVRRARACRVHTASLLCNVKGVVVSFQGMGIDVEDISSPTLFNETNELILATDGAMTASLNPSGTLATTIRGLSLQLTNPLWTQDHRLFNPERIDLPQVGVGMAGAMTGIDMDEDTWNMMFRNSGTSGDLSLVVPEGDLTFTLESAVNIPTGSVPYSIKFEIPTAAVRLGAFGASGRNLIRTSMSFTMKDLAAATEPVKVTVVNGRELAYSV